MLSVVQSEVVRCGSFLSMVKATVAECRILPSWSLDIIHTDLDGRISRQTDKNFKFTSGFLVLVNIPWFKILELLPLAQLLLLLLCITKILTSVLLII